MPGRHLATSQDIQVIICIVFDQRAAPCEVAAFKRAVIGCPSVSRAIELSGTFDFMVEASVADMESYASQLNLCAEAVSTLVDRYEANIVCKQLVRARDRESIWAPCHDGMVRIDCSKIDKVTAEGDYMRVHSGGQSWMVHSTMVALAACLEAESFVRLHRSLIVRRDFIERLTHNRSHWEAGLLDGTHERVSRTNVVTLLESVRSNSSKPRVASPTRDYTRRTCADRQRKQNAVTRPR